MTPPDAEGPKVQVGGEWLGLIVLLEQHDKEIASLRKQVAYLQTQVANLNDIAYPAPDNFDDYEDAKAAT